MSFNGMHYPLPVKAAPTNSTLLAPPSAFGHGLSPVEHGSLSEHAMPLKCRTPNRVVSPVQPTQFMSALDHLSTKLRIPISAVEPTQAFEDDGLVPGICRLYLEGRCRQGERCFQVHANPMVVEQLRQEALSAPSCCHIHGAECNYEGFPLGLTITLEPPRERGGASAKLTAKSEENGMSPTDDTSSTGGSKENHPDDAEQAYQDAVVSLHSLCPTVYLWKLYSTSGQLHLRAPRSKICREHRKGLCRFGSACSFLHICRQIPLVGERAIENVERSSSTPLLGLSARKQSSRSQGPTSLGDHFATHSNHVGNFGSIPLHPVLDQSASFSRPPSKPLLSPSLTVPSGGSVTEPLLKPVPQCSSPHLSSSGRHHGSFSHNPYAEASSLH